MAVESKTSTRRMSTAERVRKFTAGTRRRSGPLTSELVQRPADFGLGRLPERLLPEAVTTFVCGFCSTGCGLTAHLRDNEIVNVTPDPAYPVNLGMACPKGWESLTPLAADDRADAPYLRNEQGQLEKIDWESAAKVFCERIKAIQAEHGKESVAFLSTGQIATEEMALLGALAKFGMGFRHGDGNTRQCMATSAEAYKQSFGFDAPPYSYADFEESDVIVLIGANLCVAHPIMWQRVMRNRHDPAIVVVDPRRTETAAAATEHLALKPKSDLVLLYGLARALIEGGYVDQRFVREHTENYASFAEHVRDYGSERVELECGIKPDQLDRLVASIGNGKRVSFWWTMGVNQGHEAVRTAQAIINLALMTGNIGRPGTGANSITGQTNAMGSRLFSNTASLLGGRNFAEPTHRQEVANILGIGKERIPRDRGFAYDQIIEAVRDGKIKALWIIATNPAHSWIDRSRLDDEVFDKLDFLVVQDLYTTTETAARADLILPAAGAGEKEGTVINSERRIGRYKNLSVAPGEALADFWIFKLLADAWGCAELFERWRTPADVFQILKELSRGRPCDFSGVADYDSIDCTGGVQWPVPDTAESPAIERRLFEDGEFYRTGGRALFCFADPTPLPESTDDEYPFFLLTGRGTSAQWHTNTRTGKSAVLRTLYPAEAFVEINPMDAARLGIEHGAVVDIASRRCEVQMKASLTDTIAIGQAFIPMHYAETNRLTFAAFDPYSRQPSYKACAVTISKSDLDSKKKGREFI